MSPANTDMSIAPQKGGDQQPTGWHKSDQPGANELLIERVARGKGDAEDGKIFRKRLQTNVHFRGDVSKVLQQLESRIFKGGRDQGEITAACHYLTEALQAVELRPNAEKR